MLDIFRNCKKIPLLGLLISFSAYAVVNTQDLNIDGPFNVPVPFINTGNLFVIGAGSIIGDLLDAPSLHIGKDKDGLIDPANFVAGANIGGIPIIHVHAGSSFTSAFQVSGISNSLIVEENAAATFSMALSAPGTIYNYGTTTLGEGTLLTTSRFINNGALNIANNFLVSNAFENNGDIYVIGNGAIFDALTSGSSLNIGADSDGNINVNNFTIHNNIINIPVITIAAGSSLIVNPGVSFNYAGEINGLGSIINNGILTASGSGAYLVGALNNSGDFNIENNLVAPNSFVNSGNVYVAATGSIVGDMDGGISLNFGKNSANVISGQDFIVTGNVSNVSAVNVYHGRLVTDSSSAFSGIGTLNITAGAEAVFNASYAGSGAITNYGNLYINNAFGSGLITNKNNAQLYLQSGANAISSSIINDAGANLTIASDVAMPGMSLTNNGILNVRGVHNINAASFVSSGRQNFFIHGLSDYSSLSVDSDVDISGGVVDISSDFLGIGDQHYSWTILQSPQIITDQNTVISIPNSTMLRSWQKSATDQNITLNFSRISFITAAAGIHSDLATSLEEIAVLDTIDARSLAHSVSSCNSKAEWDMNLQSLLPVTTANAKYMTIQNATLNKTEMRIASVGNQGPAPQSIAYGDINSHTSMWLAGFGSVANQKTTSSITGYKATAAGILVGLDQHNYDNNVFGTALGWSNSNIDESGDNETNTKIIGYHGLLYGGDSINHILFYEWLATLIYTDNIGNRYLNLGGTNYNVNFDYYSFQAGFRFNLGQYINFDTWKYSQIETIRYTMLQQPGYDETGSPAALHVANQGLGNILTLGVGSRISALGKNQWLANSRELRAMITYDVISTDNVTTANFIVGGSDFTISNSAARWALQLGASYGFMMGNNMQLEFSYDFELRNKYTDNSGEIKFRYIF